MIKSAEAMEKSPAKEGMVKSFSKMTSSKKAIAHHDAINLFNDDEKTSLTSFIFILQRQICRL
jgi:hypothetical protein